MQPSESRSGASTAFKSLQETASARIGPLVGLPALLRSLSCDPQPIIEHAGFRLEEFEDPDHRRPGQ